MTMLLSSLSSSWMIWFLAITVMTMPPCRATNHDSSLSPTSQASIQRVLDRLHEWHADWELQQQEQEHHETRRRRPFVVVSYAQSLNGDMAAMVNGRPSHNLPLSGHESLVMTHALRATLDGILIGGQTLSIDNPRLTNRLWTPMTTTTTPSSKEEYSQRPQPIPIVLDPQLHHLQTIGNHCQARNLWVCCGPNAMQSLESLPDIGALLVPCQMKTNNNRNSQSHLDLQDVLEQLYHKGIRKLLVEGGPTVLTSFFEADFVDAVCITIAPKVVLQSRSFTGRLAPTFGPSKTNKNPLLDLCDPEFVLLGSDCVLLSKWSRGS